jgi:hypothetical protein
LLFIALTYAFICLFQIISNMFLTYYQQSPLHLIRAVHLKLALVHLQRPVQPLSDLQEHRISSLHALDASGMFDQTGTHV